MILSRLLGGLLLAVAALLNTDHSRQAPATPPSAVVAVVEPPVTAAPVTGGYLIHAEEVLQNELVVSHPAGPAGSPLRGPQPQADGGIQAVSTGGETRMVAVPQLLLTEEGVRDHLLRAGSPEEWIEPLVRIAWCESKFRPAAVGDGGNSLGLYQIGGERYEPSYWQGWFLYFGVAEDQWADPLVNTRVAIMIANYSVTRGQSPFSQWSCRP